MALHGVRSVEHGSGESFRLQSTKQNRLSVFGTHVSCIDLGHNENLRRLGI